MSSLVDAGTRLAEQVGLVSGQQEYFIEIASDDPAAHGFSIESCVVHEKMNRPIEIRLKVSHAQRISRKRFLNRDATFIMAPTGEKPRRFSGYIASYTTVKTTADLTQYELVLRSHLGRLEAGRTSRIYQHQTTPEIIQAILRSHGIPDYLISVRLRAQYPQHAFRFQYDQTDLDYVNMLCQKAGIYMYIVETEHGDQVVLGDDVDHYVWDPARTLPFRAPSGLNAADESVYELMAKAVTVPKSIVVAEYNPERAYERLKGEENIAPQDETTYGSPYIYGTNHEDLKGAQLQAQLRHEAEIAWQITFSGKSTARELHVGRVFKTDDELDDAPDGMLIVEVTHQGARNAAYSNEFTAIPADRRFRLKFEDSTWKKITGTLSARVTSPSKYRYAYLTAAGYYTVRFDLDFANWPNGGESVPLRLAKPFAGQMQTGMHFPALDNDEAVIEFRDGDPDKPYISAFQHHSQAVDLVTSERRWLSRNTIRTKSNNKLRMEDWEGQEGIKLSTEHSGKSQLNLGYLVDSNLEYRGEGIELRTSGYGALRGGKGVYVTAYDQPAASGKQLDMEQTIAQLEQALELAKALASSASLAEAASADTAAQERVTSDVNGLKTPALLMSTPASAAIVAASGVHFAAQGGISAIAGKNADISVAKRFTVAAGELVSLFAEKLGMKLFAAKGKVQIQAQSDEMGLLSDKDMTISSSNGRVVIEAKQELILKCGGSYIRLSPTGIEDGTKGDRTIKSAAFSRQGPSSLAESMNSWKHANFNDAYVIRNPATGEPLANTAIELIRGDGTRLKMMTDAVGKLPAQKSIFVEGMRIKTLD